MDYVKNKIFNGSDSAIKFANTDSIGFSIQEIPEVYKDNQGRVNISMILDEVNQYAKSIIPCSLFSYETTFRYIYFSSFKKNRYIYAQPKGSTHEIFVDMGKESKPALKSDISKLLEQAQQIVGAFDKEFTISSKNLKAHTLPKFFETIFKLCVYLKLLGYKTNILEVRHFVTQQIVQLITTNNAQHLIKCATSLKNSFKNKTVKQLKERFPQFEFGDRIKVLKLIGKKVGASLVPVEYIESISHDPKLLNKVLRSIDIKHTISPLITIILQIYKCDLPKAPTEQHPNSDKIQLKLTSDGKKWIQSEVCKNNFFDYVESQKNKYQINEIYGDQAAAYRLFLDIEPVACKDFSGLIPTCKITEHLKQKINQGFGFHEGRHLEIFGPVQDSAGKQKFRIYTNLAMRIEQMRYVVRTIFHNSFELSQFIDFNVYSVGKCLRVPNSYKVGEKRSYNVSATEFNNYLVSNIDGCFVLGSSIMLDIKDFYGFENICQDGAASSDEKITQLVCQASGINKKHVTTIFDEL